MTPEQWRSAGSLVEYRELPVFYRDQGSGAALVCIHGFPTASWDWHALWPVLTSIHRVIAPDMIGFGYSAKPTRYGYSIFDQADLVEALLAGLGIERCHVLAHDYGDTVAQELLARDLERRQSHRSGPQLDSVCLLNGGLFPEVHRARPIQKLLALPGLGRVLSRASNRKSFAAGFAKVFGPDTQPSPSDMEAYWQLVSHDRGYRNFHLLIRYMKERVLHRDRWVGALVNTPVPLRVINGPADPVSGLHMTERYCQVVPGPDVVLLGSKIGHYPQIEDPAAVLAAYLPFVSEHACRNLEAAAGSA